jgi:hypothetical protein
VSCFLDNNPAVWNTSVEGIPVHPPSTLSMRNVALVVVASVAHAEIARQLTAVGLASHHDFVCWGDLSPEDFS